MGTHAPDINVFRVFTVVVCSVIGGGGITLYALQRFTSQDLTKVVRTYRSWLIMAPLPVIGILLGREAAILHNSTLALFVFREFAKATKLENDRRMSLVCQAAIVVQSLTVLATDPNTGANGWYGLFMTLPVFVIGAFHLVPILGNRVEGQLRTVSLAVFGYLYFGWMFGHLGFLTNLENGRIYLLYLLFAVSIGDVSAYAFGKLFGKRQLRSNISPNKTVAGSVGALAVSMALPWLMRFALPGFGTTELLITGLIVGVGGQVGDLTVSYIKRDLQIKDMGQLIPGHGGLLDRVDSLVFTAPLFFHMIRWFA